MLQLQQEAAGRPRERHHRQTMNEEEIKARIGWLAAQVGAEDVEIMRLTEELEIRRAKARKMWDECSRLTGLLLDKKQKK